MLLTAAAPERTEAMAMRSAMCLGGFTGVAQIAAHAFIPISHGRTSAPSLLAFASPVNLNYMPV
jgi:hypothetical protein